MNTKSSSCPARLLVLLVCALALGLAAAPSYANVYASDLKWSAPAVDTTQPSPTVTLSFRLNEAADLGVTLTIFRADTDALVRTVSLGAKPAGQSTYVWDLKDNSNNSVPTNKEYYFKVNAKATGYSGWTQISDDSLVQAKYYSARSVTVNRDPSSPWFGRIYVLEGLTGATAGSPSRTTNHGLYAVNADFTDAIGQGDTGVLPAANAFTTSSSSPYRIQVGPEGKVYLFDWTDGHGGVYIAPPDLSGALWTAILDPADISNSTNVGYPFDPGAVSPPAIHGSISKGFVVGKGLNRVLYTVDEDLYYTGGRPINAKGSIWKYPIGPLNTRYTSPPQIFYDDSALDLNFNLQSAIARDAAGNVYQTQNRSAGNESCLWRISPDGSTVTWRSLAVFGKPDPFLGNTGGLAIDDARNRIALAGSSIYVMNLALDPTSLVKVGGGAIVWAVGANSKLLFNSAFTTAFTTQTAPAAGKQMNDVSIGNTSTTTAAINGWAVGNGGTIWNYNSLTTWAADASPVTDNLNSVFAAQMSTGLEGWAVGDGGVIVKNPGTGWTVDTPAGGVTSNKLSGIGGRTATYGTETYDLFVVGNGGTILQRLDAGNITTPTSWTALTSGTTQNLNDVSVIAFATSLATTIAYAVGDGGTILKTTDGGTTWTAQTSPTTNNLRGVSAPSANIAFAVGESGTVIKSSDGGTTWTSAASPAGATTLRSCVFRDNKTGWVTGDGGKLYRTTDGGTTWVTCTGTGTDNLLGVAALPFGNGTPRDCAFDAAGNLYEINNGTERLRAYSPPDGQNEFTTQSVFKFVPTSGDATKPAAPVVTAPLVSASISSLNASWTATGTAYQYAIGVTADDQGDYIVPWTDTNSTSVTKTGLSLQNGVTYFWYVRARSANGVWSDVGVSAGTLVQAPESIGSAKTKPDGAQVALENKVVTKISGTEFFIQEQDRSAGIRVIVTGGTPVVVQDTLATVTGKMGTAGAERVVNVDLAAITSGAAFTAVPLKTNERDVGGSKVTGGAGLPDDGLLATVWGKVTGTDFFSYLYVDDGSDVPNDATGGEKGIKIDLTTASIGTLPAAGQYVKITGVVRAIQAGSNVIRVVQPRSDSDVVIEQ